jgi:hypothetical protein
VFPFHLKFLYSSIYSFLNSRSIVNYQEREDNKKMKNTSFENISDGHVWYSFQIFHILVLYYLKLNLNKILPLSPFLKP